MNEMMNWNSAAAIAGINADLDSLDCCDYVTPPAIEADDFGGYLSAEAEAADFEWLCDAAEGEALLSEMLADDFGGDLGDFGAGE